jgi:putative ATP-binding cassette transporter
MRRAPARRGVLHGFLRLAGGYWRGPGCWRAWGLTLGLALLTVALVLLQVRLNLWTADLFDALERRSMDRFLAQVAVFAAIALGTVAATAAHQWVKRRLQLGWRGWLTARVVGRWMDRARHYQVALLPGDHDNPDGRIAEDARVATEWAVELAHSLLYCLAALAGFVGLLWSLSGLTFVGGVPVHGHMVWLALLYAAAGSAAAFLLGRPLVRATGERQGREADLRLALVRAREGAEPIALARAEPAARARLARLFAGVAAAWHRQTGSLSRLTLFTSGYATLTPVFPLLFTIPRYLAGTVTLGELMQTAQAFQQVTGALSWPIDRFQQIAEWRASAGRVLALSDAVEALERDPAEAGAGPTAGRIERAEAAGLAVSGLEVATPDGATITAGLDLAVAPGERVLVTGDPDALAALLRALAGAWPWGRGRVALPAAGAVAFLGPRPWLPAEPLRRVLCLPEDAPAPPDPALAEALTRAGLAHLAARLDAAEPWDRVLSPAEQQRLAFARLLLRRPAWVVLHGATDALGPSAEAELMRGLAEALPGAAIVSLGRPAAPAELFGRRLALESGPDGGVPRPEVRAWREGPAARPRSPVLDWMREGLGHGGRAGPRSGTAPGAAA